MGCFVGRQFLHTTHILGSLRNEGRVFHGLKATESLKQITTHTHSPVAIHEHCIVAVYVFTHQRCQV
jgi:hypothetical protein